MNWRLLLVCFCFILCLPTIVWAKEMPSLYLQVDSQGTKVGQTIAVSVFGKELEDVYGYELNLQFDPKRFNVKSVASPITGFSVPPIVTNGLLTFAHTKVGRNTTGDNGTVKLAVITFESRMEGESRLELKDAKLINSQLAETKITGTSGLSIKITPNANLSFHDIEKHWAKEDILRGASLGLINGFPDGSFKPQNLVNRAEFTTMLTRVLNLAEGDKLGFADEQKIPDWAKSSISAAVAGGIVKGYPDGTFRPSSNISRVEMAVMAVRAAGVTEGAGQALTFEDADEIPIWAKPAVTSAVDQHLIQGRGNNRFVSLDHATRAEALKIVLNLYDLIRDNQNIES
ncbi:hypothetical protein BK133_02365 [Paenibacillus sp. FSL H8-0548]|uniref:S-layer homology domain-containing protein n=1 Tax=Paenibacillus sp. FSL H8-0548 TaxID=1920422 RepID=UPI00096E29F0|nr:S-layer homology domain-containing protein [Paenibacillus sp. FSL H8-0548]OMF38386.1 hypothetical protein BK133_02365 [Paenibacillus sp. FSL H8-0548]